MFDHVTPINVIFFILYWVVFLYSVILHEFAHGYASYRLGDPTALKAGRLTLKPLPHIDPFMSVLLPVTLAIASQGEFIFGGAKPVPTNPFAYRNQRRGMFISAAAGPLTNLVLAVIFALLMKLSLALGGGGDVPLNAQFFSACMVMNIMLGFFNLLPIPPLDGSHLLSTILPRGASMAYERLRPFGMIILLLVLVIPPSADLVGKLVVKAARLFLAALAVRWAPASSPMDILGLD
jgi:Zn-dependent protease